MLKNYFIIALRTIKRHRGYAFINVMGLAVGMAVCLLIVLFVQHEVSYDRFHTKADRIYRVLVKEEAGGKPRVHRTTPEPIAPALLQTFAEIEQAVRVDPFFEETLVTVGDRRSYEDGLISADPGFFDIFSFEPVAGDLRTALDAPGSVVLTTTTAHTYFGDTDPIGQVLTITMREEKNYIVRGVVEPMPTNSHLSFDLVIHRETRDLTRWNTFTSSVYISLREEADVETFRQKLPAFVEEHANYAYEREVYPTLLLQPLTDIHLYPEWGMPGAEAGPVQYLYLFSAIALLILLIACINFMNLAAARSANRAREVGVRKTVGARRGQLIVQFLGESVLMSLLALGIALILVEVMLPVFNAIIGQHLVLDYGSEPGLLLAFTGIALAAGLVSGSYPALLLSSFQPTQVLKGTLAPSTSGAGLRKLLVVFQFGSSIVLILAAMIVYNQMQFVRKARLNAHDAQVVIIREGYVLGDRFEAFKQAVLARPEAVGVAKGTIPGTGFIPGWNFYANDTTGVMQKVDFMGAGADYVETLGLTLVAGRDFVASDFTGVEGIVVGSNREEHRRPIIVNETAVAWLGLDAPVGAFVEKLNGTVVGVVNDFHLMPMHQTIDPLVIQFDPKGTGSILVRLEAGRIAEGLAHLQQTWRTFVPERPLLYAFLDEELDDVYRAELRLGNLFGAFAVLAVVIAGLGLFGLAAFTAEKRTKEIGIRKVFGASVSNLVALLSKDFLKLVLVAFVIGAPVAYFTMQQWLEDFAYRIDLSWPIFLLAGLAGLGIALLAVSYQSAKAALADPVKSLRYE